MKNIPVTIAWVTLVTEYYRGDTQLKDVGSEIIDTRLPLELSWKKPVLYQINKYS